MKKFKWVAAALLASVALIMGCQNNIPGEVDGGVTSDGKASITISAVDEKGNSLTGAASSTGPSRMIAPGDLTELSTGYTFKLSGTTSTPGVQDLVETEVTFTSATATFALDYAAWELTLNVYDTASSKLVLSGKTFIDLTKATTNTPITFTLTSEGVTEDGGVAITAISYDYDSAATYAAVSKIEIGLYDMITNTAVSDTTDATTVVDITGTWGDTWSAAYAKDVAPGKYTLAVTFYAADDTKIGYWSDLLVVEPGRTTTLASLQIPDVIMKTPEAPTGLMAYLVDDSESAAAGTYNVKLTWEDNSENEENFVITVKEFATADTTWDNATTYKVLGIEEDDSASKEIFLNSSSRVDGSIMANNTTATIKLQTGKLYDIAIQAQNFAGLSDECARVAATGTEAGCTALDATNKINRFMITYNLNGGTLTDTDNSVHMGGVVYEFGSYPTAVTLKEIKAYDSSEKPTLVKGAYDFSAWNTQKDGTGDDVTTYGSATEFADITVYAQFKTDVTINYTIENYGAFAAGEVVVTNKTQTDAAVFTNADDSMTGTGTGTVDLEDELTFTIAPAADATYTYDMYLIRIDGNTAYYGNTSPATVKACDYNVLTAGTKSITVCARKASTDKWYGTTFTVEFTNSN